MAEVPTVAEGATTGAVLPSWYLSGGRGGVKEADVTGENGTSLQVPPVVRCQIKIKGTAGMLDRVRPLVGGLLAER